MKVLVLGCGSIGRRHAANMAQLGADIVVNDSRPELGSALATELGAVAVTDREEAGDLDAVVIATPSVAHPADLEWALGRARHALVEKPLAANADGLEVATRAAAAHPDATVMVACNLRFTDGFKAVESNISRIGRAVSFTGRFGHHLAAWRPGVDYRTVYSAHRALGGGIVLDAIHEFDYILALAGPVAKVHSCWVRSGALDADVEDCAEIVMRHGGGAISSLHLDYLSPVYRRSLTVLGTEGELTWDFARGTVDLVAQEGTGVALLTAADEDRNVMYIRQAKAFLDSVRNQAPLERGTFAEGVAACEVALAALRLGEPR